MVSTFNNQCATYSALKMQINFWQTSFPSAQFSFFLHLPIVKLLIAALHLTSGQRHGQLVVSVSQEVENWNPKQVRVIHTCLPWEITNGNHKWMDRSTQSTCTANFKSQCLQPSCWAHWWTSFVILTYAPIWMQGSAWVTFANCWLTCSKLCEGNLFIISIHINVKHFDHMTKHAMKIQNAHEIYQSSIIHIISIVNHFPCNYGTEVWTVFQVHRGTSGGSETFGKPSRPCCSPSAAPASAWPNHTTEWQDDELKKQQTQIAIRWDITHTSKDQKR